MKKRTLVVRLLALASAGFSFFIVRHLLQTASKGNANKIIQEFSGAPAPEKEKILLETASAPKELNEASSLQPKDDLTQIIGIGPKYQSVLNSAGILTFRELAASSLSELETILRNANVRIIHCEDWIEQAQTLK